MRRKSGYGSTVWNRYLVGPYGLAHDRESSVDCLNVASLQKLLTARHALGDARAGIETSCPSRPYPELLSYPLITATAHSHTYRRHWFKLDPSKEGWKARQLTFPRTAFHIRNTNSLYSLLLSHAVHDQLH